MFITESWFWRGTQSAIFYYISCSPYLESKHKRKRRKEAVRAEKERAEIITTQPGRIVQPGPFQTNPDWAEEIIMGPGPPKGWKKEKILQKYTESAREKFRSQTQAPQPPKADELPCDWGTSVGNEQDVLESEAQSANLESMLPISEVVSNTASTSSSDEHPEQPSKTRPSMERRLSTAMGNIKGTIKGWNSKRYEREDEILSGLNERLSRIWDKATNHGVEPGDGKKRSHTTGRKRAGTIESEGYDYQRAVRNPEINELHPPTVSKLPATRDEAAWMLLPPPSAAVMAGRSRPQDESPLRWPLAQIGRDPMEWDQLEKKTEFMKSRVSGSTISTNDSRRTPDLSNSSSDESWTDEEDEMGPRHAKHKRHSAPVEGWTPVLPKLAVQKVRPNVSPQWRRDETVQ